jgi:hypothetical protein
MVFDTTLDTIPARVPYISADNFLTESWREKIQQGNPQIRIGLTWTGRPAHINDRKRSCPLELFRPFGQLEGVELYSLNKNDTAGQAESMHKDLRLIDYSDRLHDFSDTAALIEQLDLVISVDTAVAHLAGALGKQVWTLLPYAPDWRWLLEREDSPWYPTMRLFRQPSPGDWDSPVMKMLKVLRSSMRDTTYNKSSPKIS